MAGEGREELAQSVAPGVLDLSAEVAGRELVGLVADDQIPARIRDGQLLLEVVVA